MRTLFLSLIFACVAPSAFGSDQSQVAFERFSYEISKSEAQKSQQEAFRSYAEELFRANNKLSSWDRCTNALRSRDFSLDGCEPFGTIMARGGTGGID
ncbi:MAG: hypothetical protein EOP06_32030 [Proteobacteria bacterium]|jgi:hypothetical protein|nr:MAG: hypothetical protein EOP06_32030 [Pseudomonadota bacterium]